MLFQKTNKIKIIKRKTKEGKGKARTLRGMVRVNRKAGREQGKKIEKGNSTNLLLV